VGREKRNGVAARSSFAWKQHKDEALYNIVRVRVSRVAHIVWIMAHRVRARQYYLPCQPCLPLPELQMPIWVLSVGRQSEGKASDGESKAEELPLDCRKSCGHLAPSCDGTNARCVCWLIGGMDGMQVRKNMQ